MLRANADETLVSVIVPAWNAENTLARTLRSAAGQTHRNLEILIINDGSTDNTAQVARDFCAAESRARLISKKNGGAASARNAGIEEAKGAWIAPLDADDLWHPEKVERQLSTFAKASPRVGLVYCWYRLIDMDDRIVGMSWAPVLEGPVFEQHLKCNFVGNASTPLIKRAALGGIRYSTEIPFATDDFQLQLEIAKQYEFGCTRAFLVGYRTGVPSLSSDTERMAESLEQTYRSVLQNDPRRLREVLRSQHVRTRATSGLVSLRHGKVLSGLVDLAEAFSTAPKAAASEVLTHSIRRVQRLFAETRPRQSFLSASPEQVA